MTVANSPSQDLGSDLGDRNAAALSNIQCRSPRRIEPIESRLAHACIRPHVRKQQPIPNTHFMVKARLGRNTIHGIARLAPCRVHALSSAALVVERPLPNNRSRLVLLLLHVCVYKVPEHAVVHVQTWRFGITSPDDLTADREAWAGEVLAGFCNHLDMWEHVPCVRDRWTQVLGERCEVGVGEATAQVENPEIEFAALRNLQSAVDGTAESAGIFGSGSWANTTVSSGRL